MTTDLERIANIMGISANTQNLCLVVQDKIKENDKKIKKLTFTNTLLKSQVNKQQNKPITRDIEVNELEYIDDIKNGFDKAYDGLKKEYESVLQANYRLRQEVEKYREESLLNKIKKIEGVR